ncbi:MAG TPA: HdeD family acid-resistance protein [Verrucomicrobiae bacterium]|nr:HdeD family acid-resistance protein [Verrucomicrobiae bacterium]
MNGHENVRKHFGWFIALGVALLVLGGIGLAAVATTTLFSILLFGWLLLIGGIAQVIHAFRVRPWSGLMLQLLVGILNIIVGLFIIANPASSALALTLLLSYFFIIAGIIRIVMAAEHIPGRGWSIFSGIIDVLLGLLIRAHWPSSALWVIGLFIAVDLFLTGLWFIELGIFGRKVTASTTQSGW